MNDSKHTNEAEILKKSYKLKARLRGQAEVRQHKILPNCLLSISVGQDYHEGEKFLAAIELINRFFCECTIMVCGSLQRHTIKFTANLSDKKAYECSLQRAEEWITRNAPIYSKLKIPYTLSRWETWLHNEAFSTKLKCVEDLYATDKTFRALLNQTAIDFVSKLPNNSHHNISFDVKLENSIKYLKEESAVVLLWSDKKFDYELYPRKRPIIIDYIAELFSASHHVAKSKPIDFIKKQMHVI